jgi:hypothetical protein
MSIVNRLQEHKQEEPVLSAEELEFMIHKLREAPYKGYEFEKYFRIHKKLVDGLKALQKQ